MTILNDILNLLFPRICSACGKKLMEGEECVCLGCLMSMPRTNFDTEEHSYMEMLHWAKLPVVRSCALFLYSDENEYVKSLIHKIKYYAHPDVGRYIMATYSDRLIKNNFFEGIDAIIPIPLHRLKKLKRGFNQSEYLALGISDKTGIPVWTDVMKRIKYTETQTHKSYEERKANMVGVFRCVNPDKIRGKHILVVDDVFTTGSTIGECVKEMMRAVGDSPEGIVLVEEAHIKVSILSLAYAGKY